MQDSDYQRPPTLYLYDERAVLERALTLGEFRLTANSTFLILCFSQTWNPKSFDAVSVDPGCLVIHDTELFGERLHRAVQRLLPSWAGIDGALAYGGRSPLGAAFTRSPAKGVDASWQFAWRPTQPMLAVRPLVVTIGSIEGFAELRDKNAYTS